jgi:hypothetical protein
LTKSCLSYLTWIPTSLDVGINQLTGVSTGKISEIHSELRSEAHKSVGGRPKLLSAADERKALRLVTTGKAENAVQVTNQLRDVTNTVVSAETVRRTLRTAGMKAVTKKKRPLLQPRHITNRMDFAIRHKDWTLADWKRVVWSDETKINRLGSDGKKWVWKKQGEKLSSRLVEGTVKFGGGSLMLWGCMGWDGVGESVWIQGRMDKELYTSILDEDLRSSIKYFKKDLQDIIFQQDNDPMHVSGMAKEWFQKNKVQVLEWPAQSPDLNPIEHLWSHLKRKLAEYPEPPEGILQLWERVEEVWEAIPVEVCRNLIESMPRRVEALYKAKGGYTKY